MASLMVGKALTIMCDGYTIIRERQKAVRREMDRRGIAMKVVALDSGIPMATLLSYFPADPLKDPAQISGGAIFALCQVLDDDLVSLLLPSGKQIVTVPEEVDHFEAARAMGDYLRAKADAQHPDSEAGEAIGPTECAELRGKLAAVRGGA